MHIAVYAEFSLSHKVSFTIRCRWLQYSAAKLPGAQQVARMGNLILSPGVAPRQFRLALRASTFNGDDRNAKRNFRRAILAVIGDLTVFVCDFSYRTNVIFYYPL